MSTHPRRRLHVEIRPEILLSCILDSFKLWGSIQLLRTDPSLPYGPESPPFPGSKERSDSSYM